MGSNLRKVRLELDPEGIDVELCPHNRRHRLTREPEGLFCAACGRHYAEPTSTERVRFRLAGRQP